VGFNTSLETSGERPGADSLVQNGALAVQEGRDIVPVVNLLLSYPFTCTVATKDFHPEDHISFASNHHDKKPYESIISIANPENASEIVETRLWPVHCVQGTPGVELIPELDMSKIQHVVEKGQDKRVEMYSAFAAPFKSPQISISGLADTLRKAKVTHVYLVGLAMDYCVKCSAIDAAKEGFETFVVKEGVRGVDPSEGGWNAAAKEMESAGVKLISVEGAEMDWVRSS
jgi:nicotinamidase-related amidase